MYPGFMVTAKAAKNEMAGMSLNYAYRTELKHLEMYKEALAALKMTMMTIFTIGLLYMSNLWKHLSNNNTKKMWYLYDK